MRIPRVFNGKDRTFFLYNYEGYRHITNATGTPYPDPIVSKRYDPYRGHNVVLTDLHTFSPSLVHGTRLGVARHVFEFKAASAYLGIPQQLGLPPIVPGDTLPTISNGLPGFNTGTIGNRCGVFNESVVVGFPHTRRDDDRRVVFGPVSAGRVQFGFVVTGGLDAGLPAVGNRDGRGPLEELQSSVVGTEPGRQVPLPSRLGKRVAACPSTATKTDASRI